MNVRFFHDRSTQNQDSDFVAWQVDQEAVPRVGDIVYDPRDAWYPLAFYVSSVRWIYSTDLRTEVDKLCMVDVYLTPIDSTPVATEI